MGYEVFKAKVNALIKKAGIEADRVRFSTSDETGKHYAVCPDTVVIVGSRASLMVAVKWGSGHLSMASI